MEMMKEGWEKGTIGDNSILNSKKSKGILNFRHESKRTLILDYGMKD